MNIVTKLSDWQELRKELLGKSLGFVPTMGHLHSGHLSLCRRSIQENDMTVCSIFVNPTQFNQNSDFDCYPRTIEEDKKLLKEYAIDYLFIPDAESLYPDAYQIKVVETDIATEVEGQFRPEHFTGMLTIVLKLFNLVQPTRAYFGEKDFQQLLLIQKMVSALFLPIEIIACQTVRAEDGLAQSSRNSRLNAQQRKHAAHFSRLLHSNLSVDNIVFELQKLGFKVDYIVEKWQRRLGAVWLDEVRLIDNVSLSSNEK